jgi:hypothetical protein
LEVGKEKRKERPSPDDEYDIALAELRKRSPFDAIIGDRQDDGFDPSLEEQMDEIQDDIKKLKRHKHDPHSGDVMTRI